MSDHDGHIELERSVESILIGARHRQHPGDGIESLIASIQKLGLLQPITITPDGVLVCGARRLAAVKELGWRTVKVWVRSGISDDLTRLLAQQDENTERKELTPREKAALFEELRRLVAEDAVRRQEASRFRVVGVDDTEAQAGAGDSPAPSTCGGPPGAGDSPAPRGHGDARHQAAVQVTGKASYQSLEHISAIERIAADKSLPGTLRRLAEAELDAIDDGAAVNPAYQRVLAAKELLTVDDNPTGPCTPQEVKELSQQAAASLGGRSRPGASRRSLRAFLLTWSDLDGWSRFYDPNEIATQLKAEDFEMFERVLAETIAFADEVRQLRAARASA